MKTKFISALLFLMTLQAFGAGKIQNEDVKSYTDIKASVSTTAGTVSTSTACITSIGSTSGLAAGQFIYDTTVPAHITVGTTITAIPGTCSAGQVQMSAVAAGNGTGDTLTFGGQLSQLVNDSKIYVSANSLNETLSTAITNGDIGGSGTTGRTFNSQTGSTYTLALTDGYKNKNFPTVFMNSSSMQTLTVPLHASVPFTVGDQVDITQQGTGEIDIHAASGVTINTADGSVMNTRYSWASLINTATDIWTLVGNHLLPLITATGGTITTNGNMKIHTFTSSGTFQITAGMGQVASLVIAGGGGGFNSLGSGGGGGAGGMIYTTPGNTYGVGSYTVTVGAGGAANTNGNNSVFDVVTATGGGTGAAATTGSNGGSGGGGGGGSGGFAGGLGTAGQGSNGGAGFNGANNAGGGGGGAGGAGGVGTVSVGGAGGLGLANSITGSSVIYASGGGGGNVVAGGAASAGGGGAGGTAGTGASGTANTGGGGGSANTGGSGGSGIVIVTYIYQ